MIVAVTGTSGLIGSSLVSFYQGKILLLAKFFMKTQQTMKFPGNRNTEAGILLLLMGLMELFIWQEKILRLENGLKKKRRK